MSSPYNWPRTFAAMTVPFIAWGFGAWLQRVEDLRMTRFRDKSSLYGRVLAPGEQPSWP